LNDVIIFGVFDFFDFGVFVDVDYYCFEGFVYLVSEYGGFDCLVFCRVAG